MALYDDTLRNLLRLLEEDSPANRSLLFRHLCDLIVQNRPISKDGQRGGIIALIERFLPSVEPLARMEVAEQLCAISDPPYDLARVLAKDDITIARWILDRARLSDREWVRLIPDLDETRLARLAKREGLSPSVREAVLDALEPSNGQIDPGALSRSEQQIRDLLGRLGRETGKRAAFGLKSKEPVAAPEALEGRQGHAAHLFTPAPESQSIGSAQDLENESDDPRLFGMDALWECDRFGVFTFVSSARPEILGLPAERIAGQAFDVLLDLSADIISRVQDRRPFDGAAPLKADQGQYWAIGALPIFDPVDGHFKGYRGTLRYIPSTKIADRTAKTTEPPVEKRRPADVAHEIRTPLNAIRGFAEMIESEIWGPVAPAYIDRSKRITVEAARLDQLVADLLDAGRQEEGHFEVETNACDVQMVLDDCLSALSEPQNALITIEKESHMQPVWGEFRILSRMIAKFIRTAACWHPPGRPIHVTINQGEDRMLRISAALPLLDHELALKDLMKQPKVNAHPLLKTPLGYGLGADFAERVINLFGGSLKLVQNTHEQPKLVLILTSST